jgi:hypothetical protein
VANTVRFLSKKEGPSSSSGSTDVGMPDEISDVEPF